MVTAMGRGMEHRIRRKQCRTYNVGGSGWICACGQCEYQGKELSRCLGQCYGHVLNRGGLSCLVRWVWFREGGGT